MSDCAIVDRPVGAGCVAAGCGDGEGAVATLGREAGGVMHGPPDELVYETENEETKDEVANEVHEWLRECD